MATISTTIDNETMLKLTRRAARVGMTPRDAFRVIATKGVQLSLASVPVLVGVFFHAPGERREPHSGT